jgi:hypothetical protein
VHHTGSDLRELDSTAVDGSNQHLQQKQNSANNVKTVTS